MTALTDFVTSSATKYLQSVVFVDDHIYHKNDKPLETAVSIAGGLKPQFVEPEVAEAKTAVESEAPVVSGDPVGSGGDGNTAEEDYHPRQLMESFAQKGIVCALYEPKEKFSTDPDSEIFRLCERADVIILDWDLHTDGGDGVSQLLAELIQKSQSESPHHVRYCAIYTSQQSLHRIMDELLEKLKHKGCDVQVEDQKLQLIAGATRISVFGKPSSMSRTEDDAKYEIPERELAGKIIDEFSKLHHGILPAFALHGLASVRRNTKRLLDKFSGDLDGAFLLHRALVMNESEAFDELPELLSDEIRAVLEDSWPSSFSISDVASSAVDGLALENPSPRWTNKGAEYDGKATFQRFLKEGRKALYDARKDCDQLTDVGEKSFQGIKPKLLIGLESMVNKDGRSGPDLLAGLFCNRTQYGGNSRRLHFGTVVRHRVEGEGAWSFSLCLMPICDSQRLKKAHDFPFWRLKDNPKCGVDQKRYGIAVESSGGTKALAAGGKMRDMLWIAKFTPDTSEWVTAANHEGVFKFLSTGIEVEWVAELKPLHAQRIAAHMGTDVSRVGLVESEWLRLFCDR